MSSSKNSSGTPSFFERIRVRAMEAYRYYDEGVWQDSHRSFKVNLVKTINLTVRGFLDGSLQSKACAMTYRTVLAIVPMLALLMAIGRGFGLQDYLQRELYSLFPSNSKVLDMSFGWVDTCLAQASGGLFVGIGIVFLLWTLISLLSSVEDVFNSIWNVKTRRTQWRKITDYIAILLILPILLICSSGIQVFMSKTLRTFFDIGFLSDAVQLGLDGASVVLTWLFFAGCYAWIPNAKVSFKNAAIAGVLAGTGFQILQWLFVSGQMYVAKYNAIYGSFSFLPLLLIWLQLVWLITFIGAGICCSLQNLNSFSYERQVDTISDDYRIKVELAILTVIVKRFKYGLRPMSKLEIAETFGLPERLVDPVVGRLLEQKLICHTVPVGTDAEDLDNLPLTPCREPQFYKVDSMIVLLRKMGANNFIPSFDKHFKSIENLVEQIDLHSDKGRDIELASIDISVEDVK